MERLSRWEWVGSFLVLTPQRARLCGARTHSLESFPRSSPQARQISSDADEKALGVLTAEQREAFDEMKGEKIELQSRRG